jgi:hypothetical protein
MHRKTVAAMIYAVCCSTSMAGTPEVNMNPGLWEWTAKMDIPNMPKEMQTTVNRKCLTKEDLVPATKKPGQECDIKDLKTTKDSVSWAMTCKSPQGPVASTGKMFYNGDTAHGEVNVNAQGLLMSSKMSGKRVGPCNEVKK